MSVLTAGAATRWLRSGLVSSPFRTIVLPGPADDLRALRALLSSGLFSSYVSYERPDRRWLAGNVLADIVLTSEHITWRMGASSEVLAVGRRPLGQIRDIVSGWPLRDYRMFGYLAFDLAYLLGGDAGAMNPAGTLAHLMVPEAELEWSAEGTVIRAATDHMLEAVLEVLAHTSREHGSTPATVELTSASARGSYEAAVAAVIDDIKGGLLRKAIISRRVDIPFDIDLTASYLLGLGQRLSARSFLLDLDGRRCAGFSPETVLEVGTGGEVSTQPLAGTRPLRHVPQEDARLRDELQWDVKECYEHVISVRLAAQEVATVCDPASVAVRGLLDVKERGAVQHLGSTVTGRLQPGRDSWDAVTALFPAVTVSGVPKPEALKVIAAVEPRARQLYAGMVCVAGSDGSFDGAVVLRSIFQDHTGSWLQAGAGIVQDSVPSREYEETTNKLRSAAGCLVPKA